MTAASPFRPGDQVLSGYVYRRIPPNDNARWSSKRGGPTRYNFLPAKDHTHLSMQFGPPEDIFHSFPGYGLFEIEVPSLRKENLTLRYAPEPGADDHVEVIGLKGATNAVLDRLRDQITRAWEPGTQRLMFDRRKEGEPPTERQRIVAADP